MPKINPETYYDEIKGGCWIWRGARHESGYGIYRTKRAHRYLYERLVGPIPKGLVLDHLCKNKPCVNPKHLEPVTQYENCRRGAKFVLSEKDIIKIRQMLARNIRSAVICKKFKISFTHLRSVCIGARWANIPGALTEMPKRWRRLAVINEKKVDEIRALRKKGYKNQDVAKIFGISKSYCSQISTGSIDRKHGNNF